MILKRIVCQSTIPCIDCDKFYVCQTIKPLEIRENQNKWTLRSVNFFFIIIFFDILLMEIKEGNQRIDRENAAAVK